MVSSLALSYINESIFKTPSFIQAKSVFGKTPKTKTKTKIGIMAQSSNAFKSGKVKFALLVIFPKKVSLYKFRL